MSKSPCIDVCKFEKTTDLCIGCFRTRSEIKHWKKLSDKKRTRILDERKDRKATVNALRKG